MQSETIEDECCVPPILVVNDLTVTRSGKVVLKDIDLTIHKGEFIGLVGPNGSGKSTLLLSILGVLKPHKGKIIIYDSEPNTRNFFGRIGWVSQAASYLPRQVKLTVKELVELGTVSGKNLFSFPSLFPFSSNVGRRNKVFQAIKMVGLEDVIDVDVSRLSGGQRQRAVIARALATEAEFILLDEPLVGVDRESRNSLLKFLDNLCHRYQKTILMVSHDITAIQQTSHRMIFLEQEIQFDGSASNFPGLAELANLRGFEPVHTNDISENKIYQLEEMGDK